MALFIVHVTIQTVNRFPCLLPSSMGDNYLCDTGMIRTAQLPAVLSIPAPTSVRICSRDQNNSDEEFPSILLPAPTSVRICSRDQNEEFPSILLPAPICSRDQNSSDEEFPSIYTSPRPSLLPLLSGSVVEIKITLMRELWLLKNTNNACLSTIM